MQHQRTVMSINEDSEILSKLGILTSASEIPHRNSPQKNGIADSTKSEDWKWELESAGNVSDNSASDSDLVYDKHSLLNGRPKRRIKGRYGMLSCRKMLLAASFICLGLSTSIIGSSLPDIGSAMKTQNTVSLSHIISSNGLGFLLGNLIFSRLYTRFNPILLLPLCIACSAPLTLIIAWCSSLQSANLYSCTLGLFLGSVHPGGFIVTYGSGGGIRVAFTLHAFMALGACVAPLLLWSSPFLLDSYYSQEGLANDKSLFVDGAHNRSLREALPHLSEAATRDSEFQTVEQSTTHVVSSTVRPKRPEHAIGIGSVEEPKSKENEQKRKEAEEKKKLLETGSGKHISPNCIQTSNAAECSVQQTTQGAPIHKSDGHPMNSSQSASVPSLNPTVSAANCTASTLNSLTSTTSATTHASKSTLTASTATTSLQLVTVQTSSTEDALPSLMNRPILGTVSSSAVESAMWNKVSQEISKLSPLRLAYGIVAALCLCCALPYAFSLLCCFEQCSVVPDLQIAKLRSAPDQVLQEDSEWLAIYWWRWLARFIFAFVAGTEINFGSLFTIYMLRAFPEHPSQGVIAVSAFWGGAVISRLLCAICGKLSSSIHLAHISLLLTSVMCGLSAFFTPVSPLTMCVEVFFLGAFLSPLSIFLFGWLDAHLRISRLALTQLYGAAVSVGRCVVPWLTAQLMWRHSSSSLFMFSAFLLAVGFVLLLLLGRYVQSAARQNAINQLSEMVEAVEVTQRESSFFNRPNEKKRNDGYVALLENEETGVDILSLNDSEGESEL